MQERPAEQTRIPIVGRFAPSPTGPLHFGSLYAALASYLDVKSRNGTWLVRIEDIDPPREVAGSRQAILESLAAHGLDASEPVIDQSRQSALHVASLQQLERTGHLFYCTCSRKTLAAVNGPYPGTCRARRQPPGEGQEFAVRFLIDDHRPDVQFEDGIHGPLRFQRAELGDFIVCRKDGLVAYHLAVVVDDAVQGVSSILRGADLLESTPLHICLQQALGYRPPEYLHIPILTHQGAKLSKQTGAPALPKRQAAETLCRALALLGQPIPTTGQKGDIAGILKSACSSWQRQLVPKVMEIELGPEDRAYTA